MLNYASEDLVRTMPKSESFISYQNANEADNWEISGVRMIQNGTQTGRIRFVAVNPAHYEIDVENKSVKKKNFIAPLDDIREMMTLKI